MEAVATREAGLARLDAFLPRAGPAYARDRNHDLGPGGRRNVSSLSPWVRLRLLTEGELIAAAVTAHGAERCRKFVEEVCWRTYFKGWLELRPSVWEDFRAAVAGLHDELAASPERRDAWRQAVAGRTGIDCFDAWVRELAETGYLHNHARMWFASIWIFTLRLPWQLGADLFLEHLLDGDPASNTLSWRWVAGLHTRGKTYLARRDNIRKYTRGRFDPGHALSATAPAVDEPPPPAATGLEALSPVPDDRAFALLLTDDDLHPESLPLPRARIRTVAGYASARQRAVAGTAPGPVAFARAGLADALERCAKHFELSSAPRDETDGTDDELVGRLAADGARDVVVPWPAVGPARARIDRLRETLRSAGLAVWPLRRPWDERLWPAATGGYFGFRKRAVPQALAMAADPGDRR